MKKILVSLLVVLVAISITACSGNENSKEKFTTSETTTVTEENTELSEQEPNIINSTIYAVYSDGSEIEQDFGYDENTLTPIVIADALTAWTGLQFNISYKFTREDTLIVYWLWDSSFANGNIDDLSDDFNFSDEESMRYFMLNSLCRSIRENYEDIDVYYDSEDVDLMDLETGVDMSSVLHPAIPYNNLEDPNVHA